MNKLKKQQSFAHQVVNLEVTCKIKLLWFTMGPDLHDVLDTILHNKKWLTSSGRGPSVSPEYTRNFPLKHTKSFRVADGLHQSITKLLFGAVFW